MAWLDDTMESRALESKYVFYNRLKDEGYSLLYTAIQNRIKELNRLTTISAAAPYLRQVAIAEYQKERAALIKGFGLADSKKTLPYDIRDPQAAKKIIDAYNKTLNYKQIYERHKQNLLDPEKTIPPISKYFKSYFEKFWREQQKKNSKSKRFAQAVKKAIDSGDIKPVYNIIYSRLILAVKNALKQSFTEAKNEKGKTNKKLDEAYKEFYEELESNTERFNEFSKVILKDLVPRESLVKLKKEIQSNIDKTSEEFSKNVQSFLSQDDFTTNMDIFKVGGLIQELVSSEITRTLTKNNPNIKVSHVGRANANDDWIIGINLGNMQKRVEDTFKKTYQNRTETVNAISELQKDMSELQDGFLIHVNEKNYLINEKFSGYQAGKEMNVVDFINGLNLLEVGSRMEDFIGGILQVANGAIGESYKEEFENTLASQVAYLLFQDYTTIGKVTPGAQQVHLLSLNGYYVTLSAFYLAMAEAIDGVEKDMAAKNIRKYASITISTPDILYKTRQEEIDSGEKSAKKRWENQREYSLDGTFISARFLKNFKDLIMQHIL